MEESDLYENQTNITPDNSGQGKNLPESSQKVDAQENIYQTLGMSTVGTSLSGAQDVKKRSYRIATVCLGLLCALLLAGLIVLAVLYTTNVSEWKSGYKELHININNITEEKNQLQISYNNLSSERDQLQTSYNKLVNQKDQLQTSYNDLANEKNQLQTSNNNLANEKQKLQKSLEQLTSWRNDLHRRLQAHNGWVYFNTSLYFVSSLMGSWYEGRTDCRNRGADLMIFNSREEEYFAGSFNKRLWVGLTDRETPGTWKWVDDTLLTTSYWAPGEPNGGNEHCAGTLTPYSENSLFDVQCNRQLYWICEKRFDL